ncbi:lysosomal acid glucosylceramidase-like [Ostrinia nubilalis]|uniref:lysosomal acid glucosylceramidase-like n=1 Tax=Ostrinia nubilalis TaxID=29057 RepID=UPI00308224F1
MRWHPEIYGCIVLLAIFCSASSVRRDTPCAARATNVSVVCVCNATYCDEITRVSPPRGLFYVYTSSNAGLRFFKTSGVLSQYGPRKPYCTTVLDLDLSTRHQTVEGFGGAVTDSAGMTWANISNPQLKEYLIRSYFGNTGIEYNMLRLPIAATDFSPRLYSYSDEPENQTTLTNFSLAPEDYEYKIPMIKAAMKVATDELHIVGSAWGSPLWMKTKPNFTGTEQIKEEYYGAFAEYHYKFIEHYAAQGIDIWGLTTVNEPLSGLMSLGNNNRVTWTAQGLGTWIAEHLGPMIRNSPFKDVKILTGDDQRMCVPLWFNLVVSETPAALDYIDGVAVHFYFDDFTPPEMLTEPLKNYPGKFVLYTESSFGVDETPHVYFGSWDRAQQYARNIIEDLNYNVIGWIDWNLCLNPQGGPSWLPTALDAAIIIFAENNEFIKQPMFYALGHFSKFLPRGSIRVEKVQHSPCKEKVDSVTFVTPRGTVVTVLQNDVALPAFLSSAHSTSGLVSKILRT